MKREHYLDRVCSRIRFKAVHPQIRRELGSHFDEIVEECRAKDMTVDDARNEAVHRLGDPDEVGIQLGKSHRPPVEWSLLAVIILLLGGGLAVLYSIQHAVLVENQPVFSHTLIILLPAIIIFGLLAYYDYYSIRRYSLPLFFMALGLLLLVCIFGTRVDGIVPCLLLGSVQLDLISASPGILAVFLAGIFSHPEWIWDQRHFQLGLVLLGLPVVLYMLALSMASVLLYCFLFLILAVVSRIKITYGLIYTSAPLFMLAGGLFTDPHRMNRLLAFIRPYESPLGDAFYYIQLNHIAAQSGFLGNGASAPTGIEYYYSNFIFSYVINSFGWLAGLLIISLAVLITVRLFCTAYQVRECFGSLLTAGVTAMLFFQFTWNILMNIGLAPLFPIPLPFISYTSGQSVVQLALLGLVMSVYRRKNVERIIAR